MVNVDFNSETIFFNGQEVGKFYLTDRGKFLVLSEIRINPDFRGSGYAQETMEQIINYADEKGKILALTPSNDFGANKNKLINWYKSLGFIMNKGKNKNYETMELMFREPKSEVNEIIRREIWTMNENPQQMDKEYTKTNLFTSEDRENVMSITNGDPFTKIIANIYAMLHQIKPYDRGGERREPSEEFDKYEGIRTTMKEIHQGLKTYNKNVFPIENFDPVNTKEHPLDIWGAIKRRNEIIDFFKQIPSTYLRNLKNEIRKPTNIRGYEYYLKNEIEELSMFFKQINQLSDDKREIMMKKIFSSNNTTFADIIQQAKNVDVLYLSSDDAEEEVRDKVSALEGEADVLYDQDNIMVVDVTSSDAMKMLGCGSQWCFSTELGDAYWSEYANNSHVNLIYNFNENSDSRKRMVVLLPDGGLYDMYNDGFEDDGYLNSIGVDNYTNVDEYEMAENLTNRIMNEITENQGFLAFHGSDHEIKNFTTEFVGAEEATDQEGVGIYFSTSYDDAAGYGKYIYTVKLNTTRLFDESNGDGVSREDMEKLIKMSPNWADKAQNFNENPETGVQIALDGAYEYNDTEKDVVQQIWIEFYRYDPQAFVDNINKLGYDGLIINKGERGSHIIIYNPSVIEIRDMEIKENINEVQFQMQDYLDNAAEDGNIRDGGYAGAAYQKPNILIGDDLNENFFENYRNISLDDLKKSTDFIEANGDIYKPTGEMISKLLKNYLIGSQNIENSLKISNNNVNYFNNLMKVQKYFKKFGLIKEDLVYWGANDASPDSGEYKLGSEGVNEGTSEGLNEVGDVYGLSKETSDKIANYVANKQNLGSPKYLGEGMFGYAYDAGNVVIKVTGDKSEAVESVGLKGQNNERIADIYNVFHTDIKKEIKNPQKLSHPEVGNIFVIILEKLDTPSEIKEIHLKLDGILENEYKQGVAGMIVDEYIHNRHGWDKEIGEDVMNFLSDYPREKKFFEELLAITDEVSIKNIASTDFINADNLGYKKNGKLAFFDAGFGDYFKEPAQDIQKMKIGEDGTSLYTNAQGTVLPEDEPWDINEMVLDATANVITERITSWMPKSKAVKVKKECQLGGNGDGTSKACNQGDMNNLELSDINDDNQHRRKANTINVAEDDVKDRHYFQDIDNKINETVDDLTESIINRKEKDEIFDYSSVINDAWSDPIKQGQEFYKVNFDLENDDSTKQKKTFYFNKNLRKDQPIKYEINAELWKAGGDWEYPVMYFKVEITRDYGLKLSDKEKEAKKEPEFPWDIKGNLAWNHKYVMIPPIEAGNKYTEGESDSGKYKYFAWQDESINDAGIDEKDIKITNANEKSAWKWLEDTFEKAVDDRHKMLDESVTKGNKNTYIGKIITEEIMKEANIMSLDDLPFKDEVERLGGKIFSVGGAVRDKFLGKDSKDLDILITGIPMDNLERLLTKYGKVDAVGKSFGVIKFVPKGSTEDIDIAIPRTEKATGAGGHKGFDVTSDHELPIEDDLKRRDFTINAIAKDVEGNLIDPYNGQEDLRNKIIRVVNPEAFADDPLRMLRAVQFASRFGFTIEPKTMELIKQNASKIKEIAGERMFIELEKIVTKGDKKVGAQLLKNTGLFENMFGMDLDQSIIDESPFDKVNTMGEFIYLLTRQLENPAEVFRTTLKGDIPTFKEIEALTNGFTNATANNVKNRVVAHNMFMKSPESLNSEILPENLRKAIIDLDSGLYPKSIKELMINGNDLMEMGLKGKEIGDALNSALINVYGDKIKNNREELLSFVNK